GVSWFRVSTGRHHDWSSRLCLILCSRDHCRATQPLRAPYRRGWRNPMATQRVLDFLASRRPTGPCLIVDLDVVAENFRAFEKALPQSKIYYAVKANPAPEILRLLARMDSSFDTASVAEIEMALD